MFRVFAIPQTVIVLTFSVLLTACSGSRPDNLGVVNSSLTACPDTPNCVSSDSHDVEHYVPAFQLEQAADIVWEEIKAYIKQQSNMQIVFEKADYMHVESTSSLLGFVDDFELHLRQQEGIIAVRSASRLGHSDFGVNKQRVEDLYRELNQKQLVSKAE